MPKTSGIIGLGSNASDDPFTLIAVDVQQESFRNIRITNECMAAGFYSIDGGATYKRLPASRDLTENRILVSGNVLAKRAPGGADISGVFAEVW